MHRFFLMGLASRCGQKVGRNSDVWLFPCRIAMSGACPTSGFLYSYIVGKVIGGIQLYRWDELEGAMGGVQPGCLRVFVDKADKFFILLIYSTNKFRQKSDDIDQSDS
jgi:hypothetical protein